MATTYLTRTPSSAGSATKGTYSGWIKRGNVSADYPRLWHETPSSTNYFEIFFKDSDELDIYCQFNSSKRAEVKTTRKFRDCGAWYHIVVATDSSQGTAADRIKIYVNGVQETSMATSDYPGSGDNMKFNGSGGSVWIGRDTAGNYFDGVMAHVQWVDGLQLAPTEFGEVDATTGVWKIKSSGYATPGTNGCHLKFENSANLDLDSSSNAHTFATSGDLTQTEDNPSNNFATMNPLDNEQQGSTFTMGNTKLEWNTNNQNNFASMAMNKGKFYWEMKYANAGGGVNAMIGISKEEAKQADNYPGHDANSWSYYAADGQKYTGGSGASYGNTWTTNDIIGVAFDVDTRTIWFSKNGTWQNSATIAEIGAGTTTNAAYTGMGTAGKFFFPCMSGYDGNKAEFNFGNGYFSTTAISSAGTNASGIGIFEYDVPTNFTALSGKGLNA